MTQRHNNKSLPLIRALMVGLLITGATAMIGLEVYPAAVALSGAFISSAEPTLNPATSETPTPQPTPSPRPTATPTPTAVPGQVTLLFSDDFDGSSLDPDKWTTCHYWDRGGCTGSNGELQWYLPDDVLVSDGTLKLRAQERTVKASNGITYDYTSGMVSTGRNTEDLSIPPKFAFQYGYAEMRAKIPKGQGLWAAFWLLPADHRPLPEVDVMEIIGRKFEKNYMVLHYESDDGTHLSSSRSWEGPDWSADWHTFALDWQPTAMTWYIDGIPRFRYTKAVNIPAEPMVLIANLAVGGTWGGPPDATTPFPSYLEIDYVKVWSEMPEQAALSDTLVTGQPSAVQPAATATPEITPAPTAIPGQVTLLFSDDFDDTSLNTDKWTTCYWWRDASGGCTMVANKELQWYQPDDVLVGDGVLKLRAQERTATTSEGKVYDYTSGMVSTGRDFEDDPSPDRFAFRYGYAEMRARIPRGKGLRLTFWMLAADQEWPPEIDVASFTGDRTNRVKFGVQYINPDASSGGCWHEWRGPDFSRRWHTFAVDWQPTGIFWYVDGIKRWSFTDPASIPSEPMYLLVDFAVGGDWPGSPDSSTPFPSSCEIDYVKVWNRRD